MTPGNTASFIVWAWTTNAASTGVSVSASDGPVSYAGTPSFSICPIASGATCQLGNLAVGQVYELLVSVPVTASAPAATQIQLTAQVSASGAASDSSTAADIVVAQAAATAPSDVTPPLQPLPLPGTSVSPITPSQLFPTVTPSAGSKALGLPPARSATTIHASEVSATVPFDPRMIGAQLAGLAVLIAAVTIAILRLSLRVTPQSAAPPPEIPVAAPPSEP